MGKNKKRQEKSPKTGNNLQLDYTEYFDNGYAMDNTITLVPVTPISIFGDHTHFVWEGTYNREKIIVSLPRSTPEEFAVIQGLPNKPGLQRQVIEELKRVLRQLD